MFTLVENKILNESMFLEKLVRKNYLNLVISLNMFNYSMDFLLSPLEGVIPKII